MKENKNTIIRMTLISMLLFMAVLVVIPASELSKMGPHSTQFGSFEMFFNLRFPLCMFGVPLFIYACGVKWAKHALTCIVGLHILMELVLTAVIVGVLVFVKMSPSILGAAGVCILAFLANVLWIIAAYAA